MPKKTCISGTSCNSSDIVFDKITQLKGYGLHQYKAKYKNIIVFKNLMYPNVSHVVSSKYLKSMHKMWLKAMDTEPDVTEYTYLRLNPQGSVLHQMQIMAKEQLAIMNSSVKIFKS